MGSLYGGGAPVCRRGADELNELRSKVRQDLCWFEGNAQGIRLVHTLMRMNLTPAQVGCILKYTRRRGGGENFPPHTVI